MGDVLHLTRVPARTRREPEPLWREALGRALRLERTARGERIADVAGRAGVSAQYLSEVERGRKEASSEILSALAGALGLTVRELTGRAGAHLSTGSENARDLRSATNRSAGPDYGSGPGTTSGPVLLAVV